MNYKQFFGRKVEEVAQGLLGRSIVRNTLNGSTSAKIIEVGAYEDDQETNSRAGMLYSPGTIFLMPFRGSYLFNIATDKQGYASCVEIRKIAFHDKIINGSGKVTKELDIPNTLDGILLGNEVQIIGEPVEKAKVKKVKGLADNCLGYFLIK